MSQKDTERATMKGCAQPFLICYLSFMRTVVYCYLLWHAMLWPVLFHSKLFQAKLGHEMPVRAIAPGLHMGISVVLDLVFVLQCHVSVLRVVKCLVPMSRKHTVFL